jgi:hypothetical protein
MDTPQEAVASPSTPYSVVIPAKAGIHCADTEWADEWIPAFAGMTMEARMARAAKTTKGDWKIKHEYR